MNIKFENLLLACASKDERLVILKVLKVVYEAELKNLALKIAKDKAVESALK